MSVSEAAAEAAPAARPAKTRAARCACCGFRSETGALFRFERVTLRGRALPVCAACPPYVPAPGDTRGVALMVFYAAVVTWALVGPPGPWSTGALFVAAYAGYLFGDVLAALVHELGHAAAAALVGYRVTDIDIGAGPPRLVLRFKGLRVNFKAYPLSGGAAHCHAPDGATRFRQTIVFLGGVLANLLVAAAGAGLLAYLAAPGNHIAAQLYALLVGATFAQAAGLVNLWPHTVRRDGYASPSDGAQLLALWRTPFDAHHERLFSISYELAWLGRRQRDAERLELARAAFAASPEQTYFIGVMMDAVGALEGDEAALAIWKAERHRIDPSDEDPSARAARGYVEGNAAWYMLRTGDPTRLPTALALSESALAAAPDEWSIQATRGAALVAAGEAGAGLKLLTAALRQDGNLRDKADFCPWLARAERACGRPERAREYERLETWLRARVRRR